MRRLLHLLPVCGFLVAAMPSVGRANGFDEQLNRHAPDILKQLDTQGVKTVGTLKFRVERPGKPASFSVGTINASMADRLENALILHVGPTSTTHIIHDANTVAGRAGVGAWFDKATERKKLFAGDYPLAWGKSRARADGFLTGIVQVSAKLDQATVRIDLFTAKEPNKSHKLADFSVPLDRAVMADLGMNFSIKSRSVKKVKPASLNRLASRSLKGKRDLGDDASDDLTGTETKPEPASSQKVGEVEIEVRYDGTAQTPTSAGSDFQLSKPTLGSKVTLMLKNNSSETRGVTIRLNGKNIVQLDGAEDTAKVILKAGETREIKGIVTSTGVKAFTVVADDDSRANSDELGERKGFIDIDVFSSSSTPDFEVSLRGTKVGPKARGSRESLQVALLKSGHFKRSVKQVTVNGKLTKRELIVPDETVTDPTIASIIEFPNPTALGHLSLNYLLPQDETPN